MINNVKFIEAMVSVAEIYGDRNIRCFQNKKIIR